MMTLRRRSARIGLLAVMVLAFVVTLVGAGVTAAIYWGGEKATPEKKPLEGKLRVAVSKSVGKFRKGSYLSESDSLPVKAGDEMLLDVQYDEPAHTFILWLDTSGRIVPLYPWNMDEVEQKDLKKAPPACNASHTIRSPMTIGKGWKFGKGSGLHTLLLLARRTPGGDSLAFAELLEKAPVSKASNPGETVVLQLQRDSTGLQAFDVRNRPAQPDPKDVDREVIALMERFRNEFDLVQAVRFAQVED